MRYINIYLLFIIIKPMPHDAVHPAEKLAIFWSWIKFTPCNLQSAIKKLSFDIRFKAIHNAKVMLWPLKSHIAALEHVLFLASGKQGLTNQSRGGEVERKNEIKMADLSIRMLFVQF